MSISQKVIDRYQQLLEGRKLSVDHPSFKAVIGFFQTIPDSATKDELALLRKQMCETFSIQPNALDEAIAHTFVERGNDNGLHDDQGLGIEQDLDNILPREGFIRRYVEFTRNCEPPLAYHAFSALSGVASIVNRRVSLNMGYFSIYPPLGVIILGPSGLKKTSATDIMVSMVQETGLVKIYSEKLTPEALIEAMGGENATGLLYAPEMAAFLSRQKYMEGIIALITRFMDCPNEWKSETIMRGTKVLRNIAISSLMCSTPDWFISNTPEDMFGGGFIARNLLVVQYKSPRVFPRPVPPDADERGRLIEQLGAIHSIEGEMAMSPEASEAYDTWYREMKVQSRNPEHELLETYFQRKPTHTLRVAMTMHLSNCGDLLLCAKCFRQAKELLEYMERFLPLLLDQMFRSQAGHEAELVIRKIRAKGGKIGHSELVQRLQYKMNATTVRGIISSLKEAGDIEEVKIGNGLARMYVLLERE